MTAQLIQAILFTAFIVVILLGTVLGIVGASTDRKVMTFIGLAMLGLSILISFIGLGVSVAAMWGAALA